MDNNKKSTEDDNTDKKLHISDVMNSISPEVINELYQMGFDDGYNTCGNVEIGMGDEPLGFDEVIKQIYEKYCS